MKTTQAIALITLTCWPLSPVEGQETSIAAHPSDLVYGELDFQVPQASDYRHVLSNGVVVYVAEDHALPLVNLGITVRVGSFLDPDGKTGLASMTGRMIRRGGTLERSAEEFDEEVDFLAADMGTFSGTDSGGANLNCIRQVLDESLALFFEMLRTPGFDAERLQVEKEGLIERMKQRNDNPAGISAREWDWLLYGREHYSSRVSTLADVEGLGASDLARFHASYWHPANMSIAVSGAVSAEEILAKLEQHFAGWPASQTSVSWPPPLPTHQPRSGVYRIEKDIPQGRVVLGHMGLQRTDWEDPDAFALQVMNDILGGGGFTSRLVKRIRSDEGLAYSAGSGFGIDPFLPGAFSVQYQSKSPTVAFAAKIALEEIERIRQKPVSEEELEISKNSFIDAFPRSFEAASSIAATFVQDDYVGRPHGYWDTYRERIRDVTAEDVQAVAARYLKPEDLIFLVVGKWSDIAPGDPDGRASMAEFHGGESTPLPLRDPLTLAPMK